MGFDEALILAANHYHEPMNDLEMLRAKLRAFAAARDWERFHTPKNLSMALVAEAGELVEHFQWLTSAESAALAGERRDAVAMELADVLLYLVMLADRLDIDLAAAANRKIALNEERYPASEVRGSAKKRGL
jgi:NTP pyrophosphatase (non-canonical NTP hydrolase)